jgi:Na+/alanine symporter
LRSSAIKGLGSGTGALLIAAAIGEAVPAVGSVLLALLLGFVAYGMSIYYYVYAQRALGAAKTSS